MVMIGIDPHKRTHTAVAIDTAERVLDERLVRATGKQVPELLEWAKRLDGGDRIWAIESAGGLGYLLAQQLLAAGEHVVDIPATLASRVRLLGTGRSEKNDPNDARSGPPDARRVRRRRSSCRHPGAWRRAAPAGPVGSPAGAGRPGSSSLRPLLQHVGKLADGVHAVAGAAADEVGDDAGPARLVRGAEPGAVVAVEVLVEDDVVLPRRVGLEALDAPEARAPAVGPTRKRATSRWRRSSATLSSDSIVPLPVGYSTWKSSPKKRW